MVRKLLYVHGIFIPMFNIKKIFTTSKMIIVNKKLTKIPDFVLYIGNST